MKKSLAVIALALTLAAPLAQAEDPRERITEPTGGEMAFDTLIGRPLGLVATVGGTALWIAQLPISAWIPEYRNRTYEKMVVTPARWTFDRPIGNFDPQSTMRP